MLALRILQIINAYKSVWQRLIHCLIVSLVRETMRQSIILCQTLHLVKCLAKIDTLSHRFSSERNDETVYHSLPDTSLSEAPLYKYLRWYDNFYSFQDLYYDIHRHNQHIST